MQKIWVLPSIAICIAASGCTLPEPDYIKNQTPNVAEGGPTVDDLMHHIRCEIRGVSVFVTKDHSESAVKFLADNNYALQVTLSLKVEDTGGLSPSLSYITNHAMFSYLADGNLSLDRQQTYSTSYVLDMKNLLHTAEPGVDLKNPDPKNPDPVSAGCDGDKSNAETIAHTLSGDLGIAKVIYAGQKEIAANAYNLTFPPGTFASQPTNLPNFGSTIQFMITKGFDTGPYWKILHFAGPSSSSKGMISGSRITTDNVILAFASVPPVKTSADLRAALKKLKDAVDNLNRAANGGGGRFALSEQAVGRAKAKADAALAEYNLAVARQPVPNTSAAGLQGFTTNIILQNLAGSLPAATH